jgi:hypothetical protein
MVESRLFGESFLTKLLQALTWTFFIEKGMVLCFLLEQTRSI